MLGCEIYDTCIVSIIYVHGTLYMNIMISFYIINIIKINDLIHRGLNAHCWENWHFTETLTNDSNDHKFLAKFLSLSAAATAAACVSP